MRLTKLDYNACYFNGDFSSEYTILNPPQKRVWRRRYVMQILNGFPGRDTIRKYKKLATICPPNRIVWTLETF